MAWSANKKCVFNAYKYSLGMGDIKGSNYKNMKVYITDSNFYAANSARIKGKHYVSATPLENGMNYNTIRLGDLKKRYEWSATDPTNKVVIKGLSTKIIPTDLILENAGLDTFNKDTGYVSEIPYEQMINIAASSKIFSMDNDNSWVTGDLDWVSAENDIGNAQQYFINEYNFSTAYNKTEYQSYGLNENKLEENVVRLSAESFLLNSEKASKNSSAMDYGAAGVLLTYVDKDKGFVDDEELPVAFYDFGKTLHSNYNFLQIDWHNDGIIKAE